LSDHHHSDLTGRALRQAFLLTAFILIVETVAGFASHSLALLADAGHILTDVVALGLAWFAVLQARRPADAQRTYGYHRVGILAAIANGAALILIVVLVAFEAARRFAHPEPVSGWLVIVSALVAVGVNTYIAMRLRGNEKNLNVRAALLHVLGDLAASIGVIVAGVVILLTGWLYADPLVSLAITALIAVSAIRIVLDTMNVLLEGVPAGIDLEEVRRTVATAPGVKEVHDLHVWSLSGEQIALSCHVVVAEELLAADSEHLVRTVEEAICGKFGIGHTTIQVEACHPCDATMGHGVGDHNHPHAESSTTHSHPVSSIPTRTP
jgi:cobalt-zinc-cadmium efflux system protein